MLSEDVLKGSPQWITVVVENSIPNELNLKP